MFYLKAKKIDFTSGSGKIILINTKSAVDEGIQAGARLQITSPITKETHIVYVEITENIVGHHEVGVSNEMWEDMGLKAHQLLAIDLVPQPKSLEYVRKKLTRHELNYKEIKAILDDIVTGKLGPIETAYFAGCGFNPGFNDEELYHLTKAMAESGDKIKWPYEKVIDKHSIGGLAGKGITPIVVSIIASKGLIIPNTSTRAITAPAGTTDVMEVFCEMEFSKEEITDLVRKNNACIIWGGGLDLAPADEALIEIEKPIGIELYDKFIVSILAKKVAMGLTHYVLDIPSGPDTKVHNQEDVHMIREKFEKLSERFGIKVKVVNRQPLGPDGRGVGPSLEARDILYVLQQKPDRYLPLEDVALMLAGELLELADEAKPGKGYDSAKKELTSGRAYKKFKQLIAAQKGNPDIQPEDIEVGDITHEFKAIKKGMIKDIENHVIKEVAHALGTPNIAKAGIFFHKQVGEKFNKDDTLFTLYTTSESRLELALQILELKEMVLI
jgi:thymidine phosphorylase